MAWTKEKTKEQKEKERMQKDLLDTQELVAQLYATLAASTTTTTGGKV